MVINLKIYFLVSNKYCRGQKVVFHNQQPIGSVKKTEPMTSAPWKEKIKIPSLNVRA